MLELLRTYESGSDPHSVQGIVYRKGDNDGEERKGEIVFTDPRILEPDLDKIAFPARDLFSE